MVQPFNYMIPQADPFAGVLQGLKLGASMQEVEAAREQRAAQTDALRQKLAMEQQAAQRAAANEVELQQLQAVPFEQMARQQQLRLLQLTNSEASRAFIGRQLEQMPAAAMETRLRRSGSIVNALRMNPEIGIKLLRESSEAEQDPIQKKAYDDAANIAEKNPLLAARMIHGMMDFIGAGDEKARRSADAVVNFLDRAGAPLYPKEPGKPMIVPPESTVLQDGVPIFTAPRRSQLLSPEEEAQKARIALAGRTPAAPREPAAPTITQIQDPNNPTQTITIDARRYQGGSVGSPGVIGVGGKTADVARKEVKVEEGKTLVSDIIDSLKTNYQELDKARAIPSAQRGPLSNLLTAVEVSGPGQLVARAVGSDVQPLRDVVKSSRLQLLNAIKQATGLSSQQLNSNVELQTWLTSVSDPTQQIEAVIPILDNIEKFVGSGGKYSARRATGEVKPVGAAPAAAPTAPRRREIAPGVFVTER
jgi:hypothetical protein